MPEIQFTIGDRSFTVTCQAGEEEFVQAAAKMLDVEAGALQGKVGRLPEVRMLLMAGLMLADKTATLEEDLRRSKARVAEMEQLLKQTTAAGRSADTSEAMARLADLAAEAEALADRLDSQAR
jgi:cell division protein ZapA